MAAKLATDAAWRRGRLRDLVAAREVVIELEGKLARGLAARGVDREELFADEAAVRSAISAMPSFDVEVSMKASYHRDPAHRWKTNDVYDIDALASTLPYCDIVVPDKAVASHAERTGLANRLGATVLGRLDDAIGLL